MLFEKIEAVCVYKSGPDDLQFLRLKSPTFSDPIWYGFTDSGWIAREDEAEYKMHEAAYQTFKQGLKL